MNILEFKKISECPEWVKDAQISDDSDVEVSDGVFCFKRGTWEYGIWEGGTWEYGIWKGGTWEGGTWEYGIWKGGTWEGGTWRDGTQSCGKCKHSVTYNKVRSYITIGCKTKLLSEWIEWFNSDLEYETSRNTRQFEDIYDSFLEAKFCIENYQRIIKNELLD